MILKTKLSKTKQDTNRAYNIICKFNGTKLNKHRRKWNKSSLKLIRLNCKFSFKKSLSNCKNFKF